VEKPNLLNKAVSHGFKKRGCDLLRLVLGERIHGRHAIRKKERKGRRLLRIMMFSGDGAESSAFRSLNKREMS